MLSLIVQSSHTQSHNNFHKEQNHEAAHKQVKFLCNALSLWKSQSTSRGNILSFWVLTRVMSNEIILVNLHHYELAPNKIKENFDVPTFIIDLIKSDPMFVSVVVGYWWQVHNPALDAGWSCCVLHFLKKKIR